MFLSLLLFVGTMAISAWATLRVKAACAKYSQVPAASGYSGAEAAEQILQAAGSYDVQIFEHDELLGDHYDPLHNRLVLSRENFEGRSAASLAIAAHECGHAIQHKLAYAPVQQGLPVFGYSGAERGAEISERPSGVNSRSEYVTSCLMREPSRMVTESPCGPPRTVRSAGMERPLSSVTVRVVSMRRANWPEGRYFSTRSGTRRRGAIQLRTRA
jgi:Putative neutral zinc metallopeptidase